MFSNVVPMDELKKMLHTAQAESKKNFLSILKMSGKAATAKDMKMIETCSDICELYFLSMIKQIDIYEATHPSEDQK